MAQVKNYILAKHLKPAFQKIPERRGISQNGSISQVDEATFNDLILIGKYDILLDIRKKEREKKIYCIPTYKEAAEIDDCEKVFKTIWDRLDRAFARYLSSSKLGVLDYEGTITPISSDIAMCRNVNYGSFMRKVEWLYLDSHDFVVDCGRRLRLVSAVKEVEKNAELIGREFDTTALRRFIRNELNFKSFERYDGCKLVVMVSSPPDRRTVRKHLGLWDDEFIEEPEESIGHGVKDAYECYLTTYPEGKDAAGATWAEVEKVTGYSRRQIRRGIAALGMSDTGKTK